MDSGFYRLILEGAAKMDNQQQSIPTAVPPLDKHFRHEVWQRDNTFIVICWIYLIIMLCFVTLRVIAGSGLIDGIDMRWVEIGFSILAQIVIMTFIPLVAIHIYRRKRKGFDPSFKNTFASFGFDKPSGRIIGYGFLLGALCFFLNMFVASMFQSILSLIGYRFPMGIGGSPFTGISGLFMLFFLVAILPGFCEEVTHRGFLMAGQIKRIGVMNAILFSSIMFGFMHLNIVQAFYAAVLGYIIALATLATRSLWTGVIIHFMNNGIGIYLAFAHANGWVGGNLMNTIVTLFSGSLGFVLYIGAAIGLFIWIMHIIYKFSREKFEKEQTARGGASQEMAERMMHFPQMSKWGKTKFYLQASFDQGRDRKKFSPHERTVFLGILFLGGLITAMTLVWGLL